MSSENLTTDDCKRILFKVGIKFGVSPKLISERLLDVQDKCDMLNGEIPIALLEVAVLAWKDAGMPDYTNGQDIPYDEEIKKGSSRLPSALHQEQELKPVNGTLRPPFVAHPAKD